MPPSCSSVRVKYVTLAEWNCRIELRCGILAAPRAILTVAWFVRLCSHPGQGHTSAAMVPTMAFLIHRTRGFTRHVCALLPCKYSTDSAGGTTRREGPSFN